jgi:3-dehydroquinate synthetase
MPVERLMDAMASDKKRRGGVLRLVVPHGLADVRVEAGLPAARVAEAWRSVGAR